MAGIKHLESAVTNADGIEGIALRYASFYGPTGDIGKGGVDRRDDPEAQAAAGR